MTFIVLFEDDPARSDQRAAHMEAHLAFLADHKTQIMAAGPLFEPEGAGAGGMWIVDALDVDALDKAAVRRLAEADPFWPTGLRRSIRILAWRRVFAEGKRLT